jgi:sugar phosphate isomerase/epimerase
MAVSRRSFISNASMAIAGIAFTGSNSMVKKNNPHLSFTTLGCPDWDLSKIIDFAATNGYDGIAIRGLLRELDLTKVPEFSSSQINATIKRVKDRGLTIVELGSSARMHHAEATERKKNSDEAKSFIDLAHTLNCPFIRVFPDIIPEGRERSETFDLVIKGLRELADYARGSDVSILMECSGGISGDFVKADDLSFIMENAGHPKVGMLWNPSHMWSVTKESPALVYEKLKKYIKHTHIKDLKLVNGSIQGAVSYDVLLGKGEAPVAEAVKALYKGGYTGSYCCEWEKYWYPDIQEPEVVFAHFSKEIKKYFKL